MHYQMETSTLPYVNKNRFHKCESFLAASLLQLATGIHSPDLPVLLGINSVSK